MNDDVHEIENFQFLSLAACPRLARAARAPRDGRAREAAPQAAGARGRRWSASKTWSVAG